MEVDQSREERRLGEVDGDRVAGLDVRTDRPDSPLLDEDASARNGFVVEDGTRPEQKTRHPALFAIERSDAWQGSSPVPKGGPRVGRTQGPVSDAQIAAIDRARERLSALKVRL